MAEKTPSQTYVEVVAISREYLGPATERFLERQIRSHLDKSPEQLKPHDIYTLLEWIRISVSFLTEDSSVVEEYIHRLRQVAGKGTTNDG